MNNCIFENKTKVYFGKGCVGEYLPKIAAVHGEKVLLAYGGGSIKKNGIYDEVTDILKQAGKKIIEFSGIMANPTYAEGAGRRKTCQGQSCRLDLGQLVEDLLWIVVRQSLWQQ